MKIRLTNARAYSSLSRIFYKGIVYEIEKKHFETIPDKNLFEVIGKDENEVIEENEIKVADAPKNVKSKGGKN